ncbi:MAG: hypothetical protein KGP27_01665 [Hyphomicrobiales bacterium]|nr:hypothetical protein [Hyphomicrobiales bacterium]
MRVIGTDGRVRWVRSIGNPRRLKSGDTVWDGIALDVTEKREALDALRLAKAEADTAEAQKARLLTSLTAILGEPHRTLTDWLATRDAGSAPPDDVLEHLQLAVSAIDRAVALLQGTLAPLSDEAAAATADPRLSALTARQRDVLTLLGVGRSNREIADQLGLTEGTVKLHVGAILRALGVANRTQAAAVAMRPAPHLKHATRA